MKKTLRDYPEFCRVDNAVARLQTEKIELTSRLSEIELALSQPVEQQQIDGSVAWQAALAGEDSHVENKNDVRASLREEQIQLEDRVRRIDEALSVGIMERGNVHGRISRELCEQVRPAWVQQVGKILQALKAISEANEVLDKLRADLTERNIRSDSLPYSKYDVGIWNDPYGGKLLGYQRECVDHFPELAEVAGMAVKLKLKALVERERAFNQLKEQRDGESL